MPTVERDGFNIYYEIVGNDDGKPLLLVAGSGEQIGAVEFPRQQCDIFASEGFRVIRMDNRDAGLSLPLHELPKFDTRGALQNSDFSAIPYSRMDMAADAVAVLNDVGLGKVDLVGASMGGYIVRWIAINYPERVNSLTIIMSGSGAGPKEDGPQFSKNIMDRLLTLSERYDREEAIEINVELWRWLWGNGYPFEEDFVRNAVTYAHDRSYRPEGFARQSVSAISSPGLWENQVVIECPTLILHGEKDPCFSTDHAIAIKKRIQNSELWIDPLMGHIVHREQWHDLASRIKLLSG